MSAAKTPATTEDAMISIVGLVLAVARPFVGAFALSLAVPWHLGAYPAIPYWSWFALVMLLGGLRPRRFSAPENETPVRKLLEHATGYVAIWFAVGVAYWCAA